MDPDSETQPFLDKSQPQEPHAPSENPSKVPRAIRYLFGLVNLVLLILVSLVIIWYYNESVPSYPQDPLGDDFPWTADVFPSLWNHCKDVPQISSEEFLARQQRLAQVLRSIGDTPFIAEPGSNTIYFANISSTQWSVSDRPFLVAFIPLATSLNIVLLAPSFALEGAKSFSVPHSATVSSVTYLEWQQNQDPYQILKDHFREVGVKWTSTIVADENIRKYIVDGIKSAGLRLRDEYPAQIAALRQQKSEAELDIMRCANEVRSFR